MNTTQSALTGGVIVTGSLFWEDENNVIDDKAKGKMRREWRESNLHMDLAVLQGMPIRYGRCSSSRLCTYTMVISRDYLNKQGKGFIIPFKSDFDFSQFSVFLDQVQNLATAEGISKRKKKFATEWGAVAIWINPKSKSDNKAAVHKFWAQVRTEENGYTQGALTFNWSDGKILTDDYTVELNLESTLDFLLCTYIKPMHRNERKNRESLYPTASEIATEIVSSNYDTYFKMNRASGIQTVDDEQIFRHLEQFQKEKIPPQ